MAIRYRQHWSKADDLRRGPGGVQQTADVGGIAGDDIGVQLRGRMGNHSIYDVPGASAAEQMAGCVGVTFG